MAPSARRCFLAISIQNYNVQTGQPLASQPGVLKPLKNAGHDAASMETVFQQKGYRTQRSLELKNINEVDEELKKFEKLVEVETELISVYLVGHGINSQLLLLDAKTWKDCSQGRSVEVNYLLEKLLTMESRQDCFVLIINDFCRSETSIEAQQKISGTQARWLRRRYAILWSTGSNQPARDGELQDGHGPFVASFLKCAAEDKEPSLDELRNQLNLHVENATKKLQSVYMYCSSSDRVPSLFEVERRGSTITDLETASRCSLLTRSTVSRHSRTLRCVASWGRPVGFCLLCLTFVGVFSVVALLLWSCQFGPWHGGPCTVTCGGGQQEQRRSTGQVCPAAWTRAETRMRQCNMLACPGDCCLFDACPYLVDLLCDDTTCRPFLNVTECEFEHMGKSWFDSTVQGREVTWTFADWRSKSIKLLDKESGIESINTLNQTATHESKQAACECLQDFAPAVLGKKFNGSCWDV